MNYFTLDGHETTEWNIGLSGSGVWNAPPRKGESIYLPGRNRAVWVDGDAWENIEVIYPCWIAEGFNQNIDDFRAFMMAHSDNYYVLTDTYHPQEYRLGRYSGMFEAEPGIRNITGKFNVVFDCDPRRLRDVVKFQVQVSRAQMTNTVTYENTGTDPIYPVFQFGGTAGRYRLTFENGAYLEVYVASGSFNLLCDAQTMTITRNGAGADLDHVEITTSGQPIIPVGGATATLEIKLLTATQAVSQVNFRETEFSL